jgi:hypothetical protein
MGTWVWKARLASRAAFCAASYPSISAVGSASAFGGGGESLVEGVAVFVHPVEDEVGGAVHDAEDAVDPVAGEAVTQGAHDRDGAGDGGLVVQLGAHLVRGLEQFGAVLGEQRLVGGDDVGAGVDGLQDVAACRFDAADQLDHDVGAEDQRVGVGGEEFLGQIDRARSVEVAHQDADEFQARAHPVGEFVAVVEQQARHLGSDRTTAEQGDAQIAVFDHRVVSFISSVARVDAAS